ncbi:MAG: 50S ribosomal protein L21 [Elusimicrobia bacterium]|nr:50S ribosomal protein L21 [Elusimicrobiota bacterium]
MYAIIETGGRQYWVTPGKTIQVEKIEAEAGKELAFDALWAVADPEQGKDPAISQKARVTAEVVRQKRGPKILVFKRRPKKAYRKLQGHRQSLTDILIKSISLN